MDNVPASDLFLRLCDGDRDAVAQYVLSNSGLIRRRIRGRLGPAMRRIFESEDIVSTVGRRLDDYVRNGSLDIRSEPEMLALIMKIASNAIVDKAKIVARLRNVEQHEEVFARQMLRQLEQSALPGDNTPWFESTLDRTLQAMDNDIDRKILWMWLMGWRLRDIAASLSMNDGAVRQRWSRIKERLRPLLESERQ